MTGGLTGYDMNMRAPSAALEGMLIEALNSECFCISLDEGALKAALESELDHPGLYDLVRERCPHLFAVRPVYAGSIVMDALSQP